MQEQILANAFISHYIVPQFSNCLTYSHKRLLCMYTHTHTELDIAIIQAHCYVVTTSELIVMSIYLCVYAHQDHFTRYY